mmetsp:Transcript_8741/g.11355  ORF Transcript_8741/g.11355 Transcript_8741/m.11355 type:complete len:83 (-) Transcript_8741:120-368(-)
MRAYSSGDLDYKLVQYSLKKYKSHRMSPPSEFQPEKPKFKKNEKKKAIKEMKEAVFMKVSTDVFEEMFLSDNDEKKEECKDN